MWTTIGVAGIGMLGGLELGAGLLLGAGVMALTYRPAPVNDPNHERIGSILDSVPPSIRARMHAAVDALRGAAPGEPHATEPSNHVPTSDGVTAPDPSRA